MIKLSPVEHIRGVSAMLENPGPRHVAFVCLGIVVAAGVIGMIRVATYPTPTVK